MHETVYYIIFTLCLLKTILSASVVKTLVLFKTLVMYYLKLNEELLLLIMDAKATNTLLYIYAHNFNVQSLK